MPRTSNDQRSDAKNPNSPEYKAMLDNRSVQINETKESGKAGDGNQQRGGPKRGDGGTAPPKTGA